MSGMDVAFADVAPPPLTNCPSSSFNTAQGGSTPTTPGVWSNPRRDGTSWNILYQDDDRSLTIDWFTYGRDRAPIWLSTGGPVQYNSVNNTWAAPLYQYTWSHSTNSVVSETKVGSVALSFLRNDPTRAAIRWQWDEAGSSHYDECIRDFSRQGPEDVAPQGLNTAFNGAWFEPGLSGWGFLLGVVQQTMVSPTQYVESVGIETYDDFGSPVWLLATGAPSPAAPTAGWLPQPLALSYFRAGPGYTAGVPTQECKFVEGNPDRCKTEVINVGTFNRSLGPQTGLATLVLDATAAKLGPGFRPVTLLDRSPPGGAVSVLKLTAVNQILADKTQCQAPPGATSCVIKVDWTASPNYPASSVFRRDLTTNSATLLQTGQSGEIDVTLTVGQRVAFELRASNTATSQLLSKTFEVRADTVNMASGEAPPPEPAWAPEPALSTASDQVGATAAEFRVAEMGNATYRIPLFSARGAGGIQPSMALTYDSQAPDGLLGPGWSLEGTSSITRCHKTVEAGDAQVPLALGGFESADEFCADGVRLILQTGTHGSAGATYRTEIDSGTVFSIVTCADAICWVSEGKDGLVHSFGSNGRNEATDVSGVLRTLAWQLTTTTDKFSNTITYTYDAALSLEPGKGELLLKQVSWTGGQLTFEYSNLLASKTRFTAGVRVRSTRRLRWVESHADHIDSVSLASTSYRVRRYTIAYKAFERNSTRESVDYVQECGYDMEAAASCLPATRFTWAQRPGATAADLQVLDSTSGLFSELTGYKFGDIDGDGRNDVVYYETQYDGANLIPASLSVAFSVPGATGINFYRRLDIARINQAYDSAQSWYLYDFDGDGRDDLLVAQKVDENRGEWKIRLSQMTPQTRNGAFGGALNPALNNGQIFFTENAGNASFADFDGDGLPDMVTTVKRADGTRGLEVRYLRRNSDAGSQLKYAFSPATPVRLDTAPFLLTGCYEMATTSVPVTSLESFDTNSDGLSEIYLHATLRSCSGGPNTNFSIKPVDPNKPSTLALGETFWLVFNNKGIQAEGDHLLSGALRIPSGSTSLAIASERSANFRVLDINADGIADYAFTNNAGTQWSYSLGTGKPGDGSNYTANKSLTLPVCAYCPVQSSDDAQQIQFEDYDGDGRLDFWRSNADADKPTYIIHLWTGGGFSASGITTGYPVARGYSTAQVDLDGDGAKDLFQVRGYSNGSPDGKWRTVRDVERHTPRNVISKFVNGLGATTIVTYAPLTHSTVYRRDRNASSITNFGRGSHVFDILSPAWVVSEVSSSSPTAETSGANPSAMATLRYRYAGLKAQAGGRGGLGFRKVYTFEPVAGLQTMTSYHQGFPLTGKPSSTAVRQVSGSNGLWTSTCASPDSSTCMQPAAMCSTATCDAEDSTGFRVSENVTSYLYRLRDNMTVKGQSVFAQGAKVIQVYPVSQVALHYDIDTDVISHAESTSFMSSVVPGGQNCPDGYDVYLNVCKTATYSLSGSMAFERTVETSFDYGIDMGPTSGARYGRVLASSVTHSRNGQSKTRSSRFTYNPTKLALSAEHVESAGDLNEKLSTYYAYDAAGNITTKATCSSDISETACKSFASAIANFKPSATPLRVHRIEGYDYDLLGRFVDATKGVAWTASGAREWTYSQVERRTVLGDPAAVVDANGVRTESYYGRLGRKHFERSTAGTSARVLYASLTPDADCNFNARYRVSEAPAGAPASWTYVDVLGRPVAKLTRGFTSTQFIATVTAYDSLGRVKATSEPYFASSPSAACPLQPASGVTRYWNQNDYDTLGRIRTLTRADGSIVTTRYQGLTVTTTQPANVSGKVQTHSETRNSLGEVTSVTEANGLTISYAYKPTGELESVTGAAGAKSTSMNYDDRGRKISLDDPDSGLWQYRYNAAGELIAQAGPGGVCTASFHDGRGRLYRRIDYIGATISDTGCVVGTGGGERHLAEWTHDANSFGIGQPATESMVEGGRQTVLRRFTYDPLGRPRNTVTLIDGGASAYMETAIYDEYSRPFQRLFYPLSLGTMDTTPASGELFQYNTLGYQNRTRDAFPDTRGTILYEVLAMDARGQVTQERRASGTKVVTNRVFDPATGRLKSINSDAGRLQALGYEYDQVGNVRLRTDTSTGVSLSETFAFDSMQRLTSATVASTYVSVTSTMGYDGGVAGPGMISSKSGVGSYQYGTLPTFCNQSGETTPGPHAVTVAGGINYCYDARGNMVRDSRGRTISYTAFDLPERMTNTAQNTKTEFRYGPGRERLKRLDFASSGAVVAKSETQFLGSTDVHTDFATGTLEIKRYIGPLVVVLKRTVDLSGNVTVVPRREYLFTDALGSTSAVTDEFGQLLGVNGRMGFDAWGMRRQLSNGQSLSLPAVALFDTSATTRHGFTGHEQVDGMGLVHMNGRIYDPLLGRFLQADSVVQAPTFAPSHDRYQYVFNNPLGYVDPTGHSAENWRRIAAIAITIYTGGAAAGAWGSVTTASGAFAVGFAGGFASGYIQSGNFGHALKGGLTSGVLAGVGFGVARSMNSADGLTRLQGGMVMAATGGIMSVVQGGTFGHGFASSAAGSLLSPVTMGASSMDPGLGFVAAIVVGGTISEIGGGKFANGAVTAAFSYAFASRGLSASKNGSAVGGESGELEVPNSVKLEAGNMTFRQAGKAFGDKYYQLGVKEGVEYQTAIVEDPNNPGKYGYTTATHAAKGVTIVDISKYNAAVEAAGFGVYGWAHTHFDAMTKFSGNDMNFANVTTTIFLTDAGGSTSMLTRKFLLNAVSNGGYRGLYKVDNFIRDNSETGISGVPIK